MCYKVSIIGDDVFEEIGIPHAWSIWYQSVIGMDLKEAIHGKKLKNTIILLARIVEELGFTRDADFNTSTAGNAGFMANVLLNWTSDYPDRTWKVEKAYK